MQKNQYSNVPFGGYFQSASQSEDLELTHVGPQTPCGEYLRRFWHPIALSSELGDLPLHVRVLGEDLVLFRDRSGRIGLLQRHCVHRGASLEYGIITDQGLRCCYHGWLFDVDGTVLETPGEAAGSPIRHEVCQGAYATNEFKGLIFAYLGPPAAMPPFPIYDVFHMDGVESFPYSLSYPCNWLQIRENAIDPYHTPFLHARMSGTQFQANYAAMPVIDYHRRASGFFYTNTRRIGDIIWVRFHDIILPNLSQQGSLSEDGTRTKYFGRGALSKWVLPIDDTHSKVIGFRHFSHRGDPCPPDAGSRLGVEKVDHFGQQGGRPYEEAQRRPSDYEAWISQGPIAIHAREHLGTTDTGVALLRARLRRDIRALQGGAEPPQPSAGYSGAVPTYAGDTLLRVPAVSGDDDHRLMIEISRRVAKIYTDADHLEGAERYASVEAQLAALVPPGV